MEIENLTFADIDKTIIAGATPATLKLIKCKQALHRIANYLDLVDIELRGNYETEITEFIRRTNEAHTLLNTIIAGRIETALLESDFKNV